MSTRRQEALGNSEGRKIFSFAVKSSGGKLDSASRHLFLLSCTTVLRNFRGVGRLTAEARSAQNGSKSDCLAQSKGLSNTEGAQRRQGKEIRSTKSEIRNNFK